MKSKKKVLFQFGLWTGLPVNKVMDNLDKYYDTFGVSLNIFRRLLKEWIVQILCPIFFLNAIQKNGDTT